MKNEGRDFNYFENIVECLETKVRERMEWLGDFVFGGGGRDRGKGAVEMNEFKKKTL